MCERVVAAPNVRMKPETFQAAVKNLVPHVPACELSGLGEPTMLPDFGKMARAVQAAGNILYFPTNGTFLDKVARDGLENSDRTRCSVSIDAATPDLYRQVRIKGDWEKVWGNVGTFRNAYPKARMTSTFTAGAYNVDEFPAFVQRAADYGFDEVDFRAVRAWVKRPEEISLRFRKERTVRAVEAGTEIAEKAGIVLRVEKVPFADGFEDAGEEPGFVSYLDIVNLENDPCGGSGTTSKGTTSCLADDMPVILASGKTKPAGKVKVGDRLRSWNHYGQFVDGRVVKVIRDVAPTFLVTTEAGSERVTGDHIYMTKLPDECVPAKLLKPGDLIAVPQGEPHKVVSVEPTGLTEGVTTFEMEGGLGWVTPMGGGASAKSGTQPGSGGGGASIGGPTIMQKKGLQIIGAPAEPRTAAPRNQRYAGIMLVTYGGEVCACAARHPIGTVDQPFADLIANPKYQEHLAARAAGFHNDSPWCRKCERMI